MRRGKKTQLWSSFGPSTPSIGEHADRMGWAPGQQRLMSGEPFRCRAERGSRLQITDRVGAQLDQIWTFSALDQERALSSAQKAWRCSSRVACTGRSREHMLFSRPPKPPVRIVEAQVPQVEHTWAKRIKLAARANLSPMPATHASDRVTVDRWRFHSTYSRERHMQLSVDNCPLGRVVEQAACAGQGQLR